MDAPLRPARRPQRSAVQDLASYKADLLPPRAAGPAYFARLIISQTLNASLERGKNTDCAKGEKPRNAFTAQRTLQALLETNIATYAYGAPQRKNRES